MHKNVLYCLFAVICILLLAHLLIIASRTFCTDHAPQLIHEANSDRVKTTSLGKVSATPHSEGKQSYFLSFKYYEQQTQATNNFLGLQCLASTFGMKIVEPFVYRSSISFPFSEIASGRELLRFGDIMDMDLWNKQTTETYGYPPVAGWEEFLNNAPRDVVIVCVRYRNPPRIQIPHPGYNYRLGCKDACFDNFNASLEFLRFYQFRLVRKVCANFVDYAGSVTPKTFLDDIAEKGKIRRNGITVLLNEFRGFFGLYRIQILSPCGVVTTMKNISVMPSEKLVEGAQEYAMKNFDGQPYVSILVRVEKIVLHSRRNISQCGEEVVSILQRLREAKKLKNHFLAMDVGKFGSSGSILNNLQPQGEVFFEQIYGNRWSFKDWEESFVQTSSKITNPAYVANLQRTIAAKGTCLLMVGGGGFQVQARQLYQRYHSDPSSWCIHNACLPL